MYPGPGEIWRENQILFNNLHEFPGIRDLKLFATFYLLVGQNLRKSFAQASETEVYTGRPYT